MTNPDDIAKMIADAGGTVHEAGIHPDGESGFMTASLPLPEDHWIYDTGTTPPMVMRMPSGPERDDMKDRIWQAGKYAVRMATRNGKDDDFDPDALIQNLVVGMLGYFTEDGLDHDPDIADNPNPIPPIFCPQWTTETK